MPRTSPDFSVEEISGNQYPDLTTAQRAALKATAADLVATLRSMLATGILIKQNGQIVPRPEHK